MWTTKEDDRKSHSEMMIKSEPRPARRSRASPFLGTLLRATVRSAPGNKSLPGAAAHGSPAIGRYSWSVCFHRFAARRPKPSKSPSPPNGAKVEAPRHGVRLRQAPQPEALPARLPTVKPTHGTKGPSSRAELGGLHTV